MIAAIANAMRLQALRAAGENISSRLAEITSYDPSNYAVVATIQPEGIKTGWMPLACAWVGNGWGMFCPPSIGDLVDVHFIDSDLQAGFAQQRFFTTANRPLSVPSGEFWLVHKTGSFFKLTNDGKATFSDAHGASVALNGDGTISSAASTWTHTGKLTVTSDIVSGGNISDQNGAKGTMQHIRDVYDTHTHPGVQTGGGVTAPPNQPL